MNYRASVSLVALTVTFTCSLQAAPPPPAPPAPDFEISTRSSISPTTTRRQPLTTQEVDMLGQLLSAQSERQERVGSGKARVKDVGPAREAEEQNPFLRELKKKLESGGELRHVNFDPEEAEKARALHREAARQSHLQATLQDMERLAKMKNVAPEDLAQARENAKVLFWLLSQDMLEQRNKLKKVYVEAWRAQRDQAEKPKKKAKRAEFVWKLDPVRNQYVRVPAKSVALIKEEKPTQRRLGLPKKQKIDPSQLTEEQLAGLSPEQLETINRERISALSNRKDAKALKARDEMHARITLLDRESFDGELAKLTGELDQLRVMASWPVKEIVKDGDEAITAVTKKELDAAIQMKKGEIRKLNRFHDYHMARQESVRAVVARESQVTVAYADSYKRIAGEEGFLPVTWQGIGPCLPEKRVVGNVGTDYEDRSGALARQWRAKVAMQEILSMHDKGEAIFTVQLKALSENLNPPAYRYIDGLIKENKWMEVRGYMQGILESEGWKDSSRFGLSHNPFPKKESSWWWGK